jgi:glycosyltransferase involved in cell wall biosynthesis
VTTSDASLTWALRWIVDSDRRDTGFAMLRRGLGRRDRPAFEALAADHRFIGFTHYGPFPLYHEAYDGPGRRPQAGWARPEVAACEAWAHCFRDPDRYLPPGRPRMLMSGSDFVPERQAWRVACADGRPPKRWDLVYSCLPTWLNELQKNWDLGRACLLALARAGARVAVVGRAGLPGLPDHPNLDYLPQLPWSEMMRVTAAARMAFLPNWWDASPRVITEALAVDVPVLVNRQILGGWKYVAPETGGFFDDEADVVEAFWAVLDGPLQPREWLLASGYGQDSAARRLAAELAALGGPVRGELAYALPTSDPPRDA